jgi:hypothetical protein
MLELFKILLPLAKVKKVVGVIGFEPTTTCSQSRYATRLRYTPNIREQYF